MKIAVIAVFYHTPDSEKKRLAQEIAGLGFSSYDTYFVDNTETKHGYAHGVNIGIKRALKDNCDVFVIINPDISFDSLKARDILKPSAQFDIWGFAMKQGRNIYYGGEIDRWRMSGGLILKKPRKRFSRTDYVTGSLMVFTKKAVDQAGFFDESFFMYYEDVEFCHRAFKKGLRVGIDSEKTYTHFELSQGSSKKNIFLATNRLKFLLLHGSLFQKIREAVRIPITLFEERHIFFSLLFSSAFVKGFFGLNASGFINKILNFILFLFMVRYLSVGDYGIYILVWAHVTILSPLVDFGTTTYGMIYLPREKKERLYSLFSLRLVLSFAIFILTVILAFLFGYRMSIVSFITLTSFVIFFNMTSGMHLIVSSIREKVIQNSLISVLTNMVMIIGLIIAVVVWRQISALFMVLPFFYILYSFLYLLLIKKMVGGLRVSVNIKEWVVIVGKSYIFVLIGLFAGIYFKIDVFILNFMKGTESVGIYSSGYKFLEAMIMLASSYNTLSAPIFSKIAHTDKKMLMPKIGKHALFLGVIGMSAVFLTHFLGPWILPFILKGDWTHSIQVVQIVIWALPFILFNSILLNILYVSELPFVAVLLFISLSFINLLLNYVYVPQYSYFASSYITVLTEIISLSVLMICVFIIFRKKIFYD
ncbi:MAG: oligosaccharide flippase family protein [Patescibacteria group bacterium]